MIQVGKHFILFHGKLKLADRILDHYLEHNILSLRFHQPVVNLNNLIVHWFTVTVNDSDSFKEIIDCIVDTFSSEQIRDCEFGLNFIVISFLENFSDLIVPGIHDFLNNYW